MSVFPSDPGSELFLMINRFARETPWLHTVIWAYATYGVVLFALLLLAGWHRARRAPGGEPMVAALWAPLGVLLAVGVNQPVADWIAEPRPDTVLRGILVLAGHSPDPALPSDHAVMAGAVAAGLFLVSRRLGWLATVAALFIAFARVYIAAHWPQDVVAGLVLGAVVTLTGYPLARPLITRLAELSATTRLGLLATSSADAEGPGR